MWNYRKNILEKYVCPKFEDFYSKDNTLKWLEDNQGRDQFVIRSKENEIHKTTIYWGDPFLGGTCLVTDFSDTLKQIERQYLTNEEVIWSPKGTYLVSKDENGIKFWGQGESNTWIEMKKFSHPNVNLFNISPEESYLVTYNS